MVIRITQPISQQFNQLNPRLNSQRSRHQKRIHHRLRYHPLCYLPVILPHIQHCPPRNDLRMFPRVNRRRVQRSLSYLRSIQRIRPRERQVSPHLRPLLPIPHKLLHPPPSERQNQQRYPRQVLRNRRPLQPSKRINPRGHPRSKRHHRF